MLQNNLPINIQTNIATISTLIFLSSYDEDIDIFINQLSEYLTSIDVNPVDVARNRAFAEKCLSDRFVNAVNLKYEYFTVLSEKCNLVFGLLVQEDDPQGLFYLKYGQMLKLDEKQIKSQFLRNLFFDSAEYISTE
ncbi:8984_t:CDS:2 [Funneliformis caledonium]|uniref:8984_t:CDS:1 n=1 Tax=Funneliformis caledonium TaxID=1117310 RepID=A0A9N9EM35_9GLOM|nr:8984_t:CDS:2 [Funneliformis caledonium]